jgi:hypothetical protein
MQIRTLWVENSLGGTATRPCCTLTGRAEEP